MAVCNIWSANGYTKVNGNVTGLQYADSQYKFQFDLFVWDGSAWSSNPIASTGNIDTNGCTFTTEPNKIYKLSAWVRYPKVGGTWYWYASVSIQLASIPVPVITGASKTNSQIQFTATASVGARSTKVYLSSDGVNFGWVNINTANNHFYWDQSYNYFNFTFTSSGNQLTFPGLRGNVRFSFLVTAILDGYESAPADNSGGGYITYTTYHDYPSLTSNIISDISYTSFRSNASGVGGGYADYLDFDWGVYGSAWGTNTRSQPSSTLYTDITGLTYNTRYQVRVRLRNTTSGYVSAWNYSYPYTIDHAVPVVDYINITNTTVSSFRINAYATVNGDVEYVDYDWNVYGGSWGSNLVSKVPGWYHDVSSLVPNTQYQVRVRLRNSWYTSVWTYIYPYTNAVASPTSVTITQPSESLSVDINYTKPSGITRMGIRWGTDGANFPNEFTNQTSTSNPKYNIGIVSEGSKYFQVRSEYDIGGTVYYSSWVNALPYPITITLGNQRPDNWSWSVTLSANSSDGIVVDGPNKRIKLLSATEINLFRDRIDAFRAYKGLAASGIVSVSQYSPATATYAKSLRTAINAMSPPTSVPSIVEKDDEITAGFLNGLKNSLNSII